MNIESSKKFTVDDVDYLAFFSEESKEFSFAALVKPENDPFGVFDPNDDVYDLVYYIHPSKSVFKIKKHVLDYLEAVVSSKAPHFFYFTCVESNRFSVYDRLADKIAKKLDYYLVKNGIRYEFYKKA